MGEELLSQESPLDLSEQGLPSQQLVLNDQHLVNLQTFICAAHYLSFLAASKYLRLSPSAVSHRINKLEKQLDFPLFHRFTRQIKLTNEGARLYDVLKDAFGRINSEIDDIRSHEFSGSLTIFSHPSIASDWLIPRLVDFSKQYPSIELHIRTGNEQTDFQTQVIDLAIYYGDGYFPGLNSEKFMEEEIFPVCSKEYADQHQLYDQLENLQHCTLLHDTRAWHYSVGDAEWQAWFKLAELDLPLSNSVMTFDNSSSASYAAVCHAGVAIGRSRLLSNWLDARQLVVPFPKYRLKSDYHYYLVWPKLQRVPSHLAVFMEWIKQRGNQTNI